MIFSEGDHIQQIMAGTKTQTRRKSDEYMVGKTYSIQPCRTCKGIPEGRIKITAKKNEYKHYLLKLNPEDAEAEGGYTPETFEDLYHQINPNWMKRTAYTFKFIPTEEAGGQ
ncbi:hypothetical protein KKH23_05465 [Patescibacteria group bacterium]|nr:hypothetical protein [Patescibacteria group bacterium]